MFQLGIDPTRRTTSGEFALQTIAFTTGDEGSKGWVYVQAAEAIVKDYLCIVQDYGQAIESDAAANHHGAVVGVATAAFADNQYGWLQVWGRSNVRAAASCAADEQLFIHGDEGTVDDAHVADGGSLTGIVLTGSDVGASDAVHECNLNFPAIAYSA